jgi:hypothetical protein
MYLSSNSGLPRKQSLHIFIIIVNSAGIAGDAKKTGLMDSTTFHQPVVSETPRICRPVSKTSAYGEWGASDQGYQTAQKNVPDFWKFERPHKLSCNQNCGVQDANEQHNTSDVSFFNSKLALYLLCGSWTRAYTSMRYPDSIKYRK